MRGAAVTFADRVARRLEAAQVDPGAPARAAEGGGGPAQSVPELRAPRPEPPSWDVLLTSDMLDLAAFRGLAPPRTGRLPAVVYFHENQLTYPTRSITPAAEEGAADAGRRDLHPAFTNVTTALAADAVWFNSAFHRDQWLQALPGLLGRLPDHRPRRAVERIASRSRVEPPGIEVPGLDDREWEPAGGEAPTRAGTGGREERRPGPLRLLWAARWEHDKAPERFFAALEILEELGVDFRLSVLGESFRRVPPVFATARDRFAPRIDRWGWQESRRAYATALAESDVVVSTADHEFFGLAVVEAVAAGCLPLLPDRLAYPEVLAEAEGGVADFLYDGAGEPGGEAAVLAGRLRGLAGRLEAGGGTRQGLWGGDPDRGWRAVRRFAWPLRAARLDAALEEVVGAAADGR